MEMMYQYLWKYRLLRPSLRLTDGRSLEIISPGLLNSDSGPDFFNAKIKVDGVVWIGNVEIHVKSSDWYLHNHHHDRAYDNVVLHVVADPDREVTRTDGSTIAQLAVDIPPGFISLYADLSESISSVKCRSRADAFTRLDITDCVESMAVERLQAKTSRILELLDHFHGDWQQVCFVTYARALGFGLNGEPFEMLAKSVPLNFLSRHSDSLPQIEAILFGQAGMLDPSVNIFDEYYQHICREYIFLARKYGMRPMRPEAWKYARTRPGNFPDRRIALLAASALGGFSMMRKITDADFSDRDSLRSIFSHTPGEYWRTHAALGIEGTGVAATLSQQSLDILLINVAAPLAYAYGLTRGIPRCERKALDLLQTLPAENNAITRGWREMGITADCAFRSQALIHLRKEYCDKGKCLYCRLGHRLLRRNLTLAN